MKKLIHVKFLRAAISGICFLAISFGTVTHISARTFFADDFASYKAAVDEINANNTGADTIRIIGDILITGTIYAINGDITIIGDANPDGTPKYTMDGDGRKVIAVTCQQYCTIENVKVANGSYGIEVGIKNGFDNCSVKIDHCIATDNLFGIKVTGPYTYQQKIAITNCTVSNTRDEGIYVYGITIREPEDFIIHNCVCNNNGTGFSVSSPESLSMSDCEAYDNTLDGIDVHAFKDNHHVIIDNCVSKSNGRHGFYVRNDESHILVISNSTAADNGGGGFSLSHCRLINCIADNNVSNGFQDNGHATLDKCVAMNNGGLYGFNCPNSLITNSTAVNNEKMGINGSCIINCTSSHNGTTGIYSGKTYNSITYGNVTDIANNSSLYNSVYATGNGKEKIECTQDDPKLQGRTVSGEYTDDPAQTVCYTLDEGSSALGLADRSWISIENLLAALNYQAWFADNLSEDYLANMLLYDQMGNVRQFSGDRYDAGAMTGNIPNDKYYILSYNPAKGANYGKTPITFYGAGFHEQMKISLKRTGESDIIAETIELPSAIRCDAVFNLDDKRLGKWNIVFDFGDETLTLENGFEIETYIEPEIELDIFGPVNVRNGRWGTYTVKYSNKGNVAVYCQPVIAEVIARKEVTVEVRERWNYIYTEGAYTDPYAEIDGVIHKLDTLHISADVYKTLVTPLILSIPPYGKGYVTFDVRCEVEGAANEVIDILTYTIFPLWGDDMETEGSTKQPKRTNSLFGDGCLGALAGLGWDLGSDFVPGLGCATQAAQSLHSMHNNPNDNANTMREMGKTIMACAADVVPGGTAAKKAAQFISELSSAAGLLQDFSDVRDKCGPNNDEPKHHFGNLVGSVDPNDKCGPLSESGSTWFSDRTTFTYVINFENSPEATAPAQEVWVTDTLDLNVFDIESFEAEILNIGGKIIETPFEQQNYTWTVDMRPDMNLITKIYLTLNKSAGVAVWYFKSIDPATGELPDDALAGFLPPNDDDGAGQGFVMFTIKLKAGLADNVVVANKATIVFDNNEAIVTPEWVNEKDVVPPTSAMLRPENSTGAVELKWQGEDNASGSGVYCYDIYLKQDDGEYERIIAKTTATSMPFTVKEGVKYALYTIATDNAGNRENDKINPDITLPFDNLPFDTYAVTKWDNTFMLNLRKLSDDGYSVAACRWFKNGEPIGDGFTYSAGPEITDKLETGAVYHFQLTTRDGNELLSTNKVIGEQHSNKLCVYPNPVPQGNRLTIEGIGQGDLVEVYNYMGICVSRITATGNIVEMMLAVPTGLYVVRAKGENVKVVIK